MIRLRRCFLHLALWLCLGAIEIHADGADDAFIRIYNLIQQADAHRETGQWSAAREAYTDHDDLERRRHLLRLWLRTDTATTHELLRGGVPKQNAR